MDYFYRYELIIDYLFRVEEQNHWRKDLYDRDYTTLFRLPKFLVKLELQRAALYCVNDRNFIFF